MDLFDIGDRVRAERKRKSMTQQDLADASGLSRARINHLEGGTALDMKIGNVLNVLNTLGVDLKMTDFNSGRATFDDLREENEAPQEDDSPSPE
jgi:transcriptional regulator with XRE-family HTH domain